MHIGELAERTGLSLRSIRHYDEVGLLPGTERTEGGFRVFSEADYGRLLTIMQLKPMGFALDEMPAVLDVLEGRRADSGEVAGLLERSRGMRDRLARQLAAAEDVVRRLEDLGRATG
ncbi:MerR family transcriptional regulator [Arthrobacter halodurans]|uniref:MerR family transcriptional regulator n=1 Tax=Arthrobacter halodurans TaxID=516699 RepID=A0ABV4UJ39_9MICC